MDSNTLGLLIEKMKQTGPSEAVGIMYEAKDAHRAICYRQWPTYVKCFEDTFDLLVYTVFDLNYIDKTSWSTQKGLQYFFYPGMLKTSFRAFEDILDGYYEESMMLIRSVYESLLRIVFISCYPNDWQSAVFTSTPRDKRQFRVGTFTKQELRIDWDIFYKLPSYLLHGRKQDVISFLASAGRRDNKPVFFTHEYDDKKVTMPINFSLFTTWLMLRFMAILFSEVKDHPKLRPETRIRWENTEKAFEAIIAASPTAYAQTIKDVRKIEKILTSAATGQNWSLVARNS